LMYLLFLLVIPLVAFIAIPVFLVSQRLLNRKRETSLDEKLLSSELNEHH
jgi:hypothetical protein